MLEIEEERERMKRSVPAMFALPPPPPLLPQVTSVEEEREVGAISKVGKGHKGYSPYDVMGSIHEAQHAANALCDVQVRTLATTTPPPVEQSARGTVVLHKIGVITARLMTPLEMLLQSCFDMMPEWTKSLYLDGRCHAVQTKTTRLEAQDQELGAKGRKEQKAGKMEQLLYWISVVSQVAQSVFSTFIHYLYQGLVFVHDRSLPLLGRVTHFCMEKSAHLLDACQEAWPVTKNHTKNHTMNHPLSWLKDGCQKLMSWLKALVS